MDAIERAIKKELHISKNEKLNQQTWEMFEKCKEQKKIYLFGVGACSGHYWERYAGEAQLSGIIDNDVKKQGLTAGDLIPEALGTSEENMQIFADEELKKYDKNQMVVLIASINFYEEIIQQLQLLGIENFFVLLIMEANARKEQSLEMPETDVTAIYQTYAQQVCEEEPIQKNKIVFRSFDTFSDHGKYITEQLLRKRKDLDIVWIVNDLHTTVPCGVRLVWTGNWKKYIYEMETARVWIVNTIIMGYIIKRPQQVYIHTKHWASITLKKFYLDASTITDVSTDVELWKYNSRCMDYIFTGSKFDEESCRRGFDFHKEAIDVGSPRTDAMFWQEVMKQKVYEQLGIVEKMQTLLYAPTYRYKKENEEKHEPEARGIELDFKAVKNALEKRFGGQWCIILRLHPSVAKVSNQIAKPDFVVDASTYEDSEELASACDMMISDYSSIMFEPSFVKKTVFLFATDKKDYIDKEYDLLLDYDKLPFPIAESNEELVAKIESFDKDIYEKNLETFFQKYGVHEDGHASERAAEFISKLIDERDADA